MELDRVRALSYIAPEENISSICSLGILSHLRARNVSHVSVASESVQSIRARVRVPCSDGSRRALHSYVNLYFCPRNPMMYRVLDEGARVCVVETAPEVMGVAGTIIADRNAAQALVRFAPFPEGLAGLDADLVYARYWTHDDPIEYAKRKAIKCAEVLVPDLVPPQYISRILVLTEEARSRIIVQLGDTTAHLEVEVNGDVFFHS